MPKNTQFRDVEIDGIKIFCEVSAKEPRPYIPEPLRHQLMSSLHSMDHIGWKPSLKRIAGEYYWPSVKNDVKVFCNPGQWTQLNSNPTNLSLGR